MYIIMFHAFPFHTLEALTAGSLEATAITHERKGPSDLPTKPPSIMVHVNLQGNVWLHEFASSDRHPPTQAGTKTLFKAVKAFEKRESCDEAAKAGGANVDCGFPMISQIFWSCFCHLWNLFLFVLLNGF